MMIKSDVVKKLRERTGAGIMNCKAALKESGGDIDKAVSLLRKKGIETASKRSSKATNQGVVASYVHTDSRLGVLVELNCETDFVARCDDFKKFSKDIAMQIAAANPAYLKREDVPKDIIDKEIEIFKEQHKDKPAQVADKIAAGKLDKFYKEACLMEQPFIRDQNITISDHLNGLIAKLGENIIIRRFIRYQLGEEL